MNERKYIFPTRDKWNIKLLLWYQIFNRDHVETTHLTDFFTSLSRFASFRATSSLSSQEKERKKEAGGQIKVAATSTSYSATCYKVEKIRYPRNVFCVSSRLRLYYSVNGEKWRYHSSLELRQWNAGQYNYRESYFHRFVNYFIIK